MIKRIIRILVIILCAALISVSVTYSWILETERTTVVARLVYDYQGIHEGENIKVVSIDGLSAEFYIYDARGEEVLVESDMLEWLNMLPGDSFRFKIRLFNTGSKQHVKLFATGLTGMGEGEESNEIFDYIYFSSWPGEGYDSYNTDLTIEEYPYWQFEKISTLMGDSPAVATIYSDLVIPYTGEDGIDLECRFWFEKEGESIQSSGISINYFSITP